MLNRLIIASVLLSSPLLAQVNNYYVATTGNDSRTPVQAQNPATPWATIKHCDQNLTLGANGAVCHVASGTYTSNDSSLEIITTRNGTSTQPITFLSDTRWGARIVCNGTVGFFGYCWEAQGNYQTVQGFEIVGGASPQPTAVGLRLTGGGTPTHNITARNNLVHNFAPECNHAAGLGGAGIINNGNTSQNSFIGNVVYDIGVNPPSGGYGVCSLHTGLYMASPGGGLVQNNIVYQVDFTGILTWHGATGLAITNNTVFHVGHDAILIGCGDSGCTSNISNTLVANNVIRNNNNGIRTEGSVGPGNVCANNDLFANTTNFVFDSGTTPCTQTANITNDPLMVNFSLTPGTPSASGGVVSWPSADFHLTAPSLARSSGTSTCIAAGTATGCIPPIDFDGNVRPTGGAQSIGAYIFVGSSAPAASFSPSPLSFGNVTISTSSTLTATLSNTGTANLTFSTPASISGTNASDFVIVTTTCASPLAASASCTYSIRFTPSAAGARSATLTLTDNAVGSPHQLPLTGIGGTATITLNPTSLSFGTIAPGSCSTAQTSTVTNTGNVSVTINPFSFSPDETNFQSGGVGTCGNGLVLAAGQSCLASAKLCPSTTGALTATLNIPAPPATTATLPLSGSGGTTTALLSPATFAYGNQQVGTASAAHVFTYVNSGTLPLNISSVAVNSTSFTVTDDCPRSPLTLAVANACNVNVIFRPQSVGALSGIVTVTGDATRSSTLSGTGTTAQITLSPSTFNFGSVLTGTTSATNTFTIINSGGASATIGSITTAAPFNVVSTTCGATLAAGAQCTADASFSPTALGLVSGQLVVADNAPGNPHTATLSGTGVAPAVTLLPAMQPFSNQAVGSTSAPMTTTLSNTGTGPLTFTIAIVGANLNDFILGTGTCVSPLAGGSSCTIPVSFKPTLAGARVATLQVTDSAVGSPHTTALTGTGIATAPAVCLNKTTVNFANQPVGTTSGSQPVIVTNCGTANLSVSSVTPTISYIDRYPSDIGGPTCVPQSTGGRWCGKFDTGTPGAATGSSQGVTTPTVSGFARQFVANTSGSGGFRFSSYLGPTEVNPTSTAFTYDTYVRVNDATQASHFEFDLYQGLLNGHTIIYGVQCSFLSSKWEYTTALNPTTSQWTASNLACSAATFPANTYIHLVFAYHRSGGTVTYDSVTINGVTSNFIGASGSSEFTIGFVPVGILMVNYQVDGLAGATTTTSYLDSLFITGTTPTSPFTATTTGCATVTPNATCTVNNFFSPTLPGSVAGQVAINSNAASTPNILQLQGFGTQLGGQFNPASIDFGTVTVGVPATPVNLVLTNVGNAPLTVNIPSITGSNSADFTFSGICGTLAVNASCTYSVSSTPSAAGARTATFSQTLQGGASTLTVPLTVTGQATAPAVTLTPSSINFGSITQGVATPSQVIQLTNSGTAALSVTSVTATGTNSGDVTLSADHCTGVSVPAGGVCTVSVAMTPGGLGSRTANAHYVTNAASSPDNVTLAVIGLAAPAPKVSLAPASLTFSNITVGQTSAASTVTATNTGDANLHVSSVALGGANPGDYTLSNNCGTVIPGLTCTATVNCVPTAIGTRTATVVFTDDATGSPHTSTLSCVAIAGTPNSVVGATNVNFGNTVVGTTSGPATFTITNTGTADLTTTVTVSGDFTQLSSCGTITAGNSCSVSVRFSPAALCGQFSETATPACISNVHLGVVTITSNAVQSPQTVTLQGTAISPLPPLGPIIISSGGHLKFGGHVMIGFNTPPPSACLGYGGGGYGGSGSCGYGQ